MPPANSPSETRPSTPPPYGLATANSSLSSHPYLQQFQEAISTPVPDLASTLTTPQSQPRSERRRTQSQASNAWDGRTVVHLSRNHDYDQPSQREPLNRPSDGDMMSRMESEVDRSQSERSRLRSILHTQQNRQSMLEEQNFRLREQRSRLQEEHTRLYEQSSRMNDRHPPLRHDLPSNLSNLAGAIAEVGRDSYATTGSGPSRQRLYDWAATRQYSRLASMEDDEGEDSRAHTASGEVDSTPRRELERALRNYRMTRSAFRSGRQPGADLGAVPTASALRAYWTEDPNELPGMRRTEEASVSRTPFALSEFVEQHRVERQRRHLEVIRRHTEQRRSEAPQSMSNDTLLPSVPHISDASVRVRNTIRYLSALRHTHPHGALELARSFGLNSLHEFADATTPSYLPLSLESLPLPQPSSWLTPGMTWHGLQSTDREPSRPAMLTRMQRREALGISMARSRLAGDRSSGSSSSLLPEFTPSHQPLDTDRYISSLMQDSEGRWGFDNEPASHEYRPRASFLEPHPTHAQTSTSNPTPADVDHWPVTVTLHSVDFDTMTISGTMRASQLPDKMGSAHREEASSQSENLKSMESYFQGEIIDLRHHTLETDAQKYSFKSGAADVDARYWARLGPFKREIERQSSSTRGMNNKVWDIKMKAGEKYLEMIGNEERERIEGEADEVMARCLGDGRWLEEKLGARSGEWVLMRWKEKCFVDPIINASSSSSSSPAPTPTPSSDRTPRPRHPGTSSSPRDRRTMTDSSSAQWGLTISGFYYIALNRVTGELDGLYFDPGSQPFQSLKMIPADGASAPATDLESVEGRQEGERECEGLGVAASAGAELKLGVRRWFPAVEFR